MPSQFEPCGIGELIALRHVHCLLSEKQGDCKIQLYRIINLLMKETALVLNYNAHDMLYTIEQLLAYIVSNRKSGDNSLKER